MDARFMLGFGFAVYLAYCYYSHTLSVLERMDEGFPAPPSIYIVNLKLMTFAFSVFLVMVVYHMHVYR